MDKKLTCKESVELVTDYLEKSLLPGLETQFEAHLAGCTGCTVYLAQMQQTIQWLHQLTDETIPEADKKTLLAQFRLWQKNQEV
jgi:anti-sigma factor RsiW